jgi:hypothetical protein
MEIEEAKMAKRRVDYCPICYEMYPLERLQCGFDVCIDCISAWVEQNVLFSSKSDEFEVRCPNAICKHKMDNAEIKACLSLRQYRNISDKFVKFYLARAEDVRSCPNSNCRFAGVVPQKLCSEQLCCPQCGT